LVKEPQQQTFSLAPFCTSLAPLLQERLEASVELVCVGQTSHFFQVALSAFVVRQEFDKFLSAEGPESDVQISSHCLLPLARAPAKWDDCERLPCEDDPS